MGSVRAIFLLVLGFTIASIISGLIIWLRACYSDYYYYILGNAYDSTSCCCCCWFHAVPYVGLTSIPFIIVMAWTDGISQGIHFVSAVVGLGILSLYCILQSIFLAIIIFRIISSREQNLSRISQRRLVLTSLSVIFYILVGIATPTCVVLWILLEQSVLEWVGVICLFGYMLPYLVEFLAIPRDSGAHQEILITYDDD